MDAPRGQHPRHGDGFSGHTGPLPHRGSDPAERLAGQKAAAPDGPAVEGDRTADVKTCEIRRFFCKKDFTEPEKYSIIAKAVIRAANENL